MPDDLIHSILFYFICGTMDVLITAIVLSARIGYEANPLYNWITPWWLLVAVALLGNFGFCMLVVYLAPKVPQHMFIYKTIIKYGLIGEGLGRIAFGVFPGLVLIWGAGWV